MLFADGNLFHEIKQIPYKVMKTSDVVRTLPNSQDILKFSWSVNSVEDYEKFEEGDNEGYVYPSSGIILQLFKRKITNTWNL